MASLPYPLYLLGNHGRVDMAGMPYPPTFSLHRCSLLLYTRLNFCNRHTMLFQYKIQRVQPVSPFVRQQFQALYILSFSQRSKCCERYLEWQAECSPGCASINSAAIRGSLGRERLVSHEVLMSTSYECDTFLAVFTMKIMLFLLPNSLYFQQYCRS